MKRFEYFLLVFQLFGRSFSRSCFCLALQLFSCLEIKERGESFTRSPTSTLSLHHDAPQPASKKRTRSWLWNTQVDEFVLLRKRLTKKENRFVSLGSANLCSIPLSLLLLPLNANLFFVKTLFPLLISRSRLDFF